MFGDDTKELFDGLIPLLKEWNPSMHTNEKEYQTDLFDYLTRLKDKGKIRNDRLIRKEHGENRIDIKVNGVGIELKKHLNRQSPRDRATGQVKRMLAECNYLIIIFVGDSKSNREGIDVFKAEIKDFQREGDMLGRGEKVIRFIDISNKTSEHDSHNTDFTLTIPKKYLPTDLGF